MESLVQHHVYIPTQDADPEKHLECINRLYSKVWKHKDKNLRITIEELRAVPEDYNPGDK